MVEDNVQEMEEVQDILDTTFDLADFKRFVMGLQVAAYEDAILTYNLTPDEAATLCISEQLKEEFDFKTYIPKEEETEDGLEGLQDSGDGSE